MDARYGSAPPRSPVSSRRSPTGVETSRRAPSLMGSERSASHAGAPGALSCYLRRMRPSALVLCAVLVLSCAKSSTLREEQPVNGGLGKYPSVAVETKLEGDAEKEAAGFDGRLTERVVDQLKGKS